MPARRKRHPDNLQTRLASRILEEAESLGLGAGAWLSENALAQSFGVSRTPVRGALQQLARDGLLSAVPRRGYLLRRRISRGDLGAYEPMESPEDRLSEQMAADRFNGTLAQQVSEADLIRRYRVPRSVLTRVLGRMAQDGIIERRDGHGWQFMPTLDSEPLHDESYRFRLLVEPAAILEPTFRLDRDVAARIKSEHERVMAAGFRHVSSVAFYDLNAEFHELVARSSGNRFLHLAVVQQNRLRRFFSYHWTYGETRMRESCEEHLGILEALLLPDSEKAAALMRLHLLGASRVRPAFGG